jgi:hypothetical protein
MLTASASAAVTSCAGPGGAHYVQRPNWAPSAVHTRRWQAAGGRRLATSAAAVRPPATDVGRARGLVPAVAVSWASEAAPVTAACHMSARWLPTADADSCLQGRKWPNLAGLIESKVDAFSIYFLGCSADVIARGVAWRTPLDRRCTLRSTSPCPQGPAVPAVPPPPQSFCVLQWQRRQQSASVP